ncbi:hypothetical protein BDZ94DRAFT_1316034 [Collybia nuda]|uniref:Uncharacterized protein n=1 Tax=Collybia nuda TaxID=64659 RepID=A0A9P5XRL4_9AGAR|nr:hypothetical protein BDZ94DRAFT_1316034 [Collybia nuda]
MSSTRSAVDAIISKASTLLEFHLGMAKLGMAPVDCNPKLIEAAQVALELEKVRSNRERMPDVQGIVMADASLTTTIAYKKLRAFTKLIHEHRGTTKATDEVPVGSRATMDSGATVNTAPSTIVVTASGGKSRGGKRKQTPRSTRRSGRICTNSVVEDESEPEGEVGLFDEDVEMNGPDELSIETGVKIAQGIVPPSDDTVSEAGRPIRGRRTVEGKHTKASRSSSVPSKEVSKVVGKRSETANFYASKGEANEEAKGVSTQNKKARTGYAFPDSHTVLESTSLLLVFVSLRFLML